MDAELPSERRPGAYGRAVRHRLGQAARLLEAREDVAGIGEFRQDDEAAAAGRGVPDKALRLPKVAGNIADDGLELEAGHLQQRACGIVRLGH